MSVHSQPHEYQTPHFQILRHFLYMLPVGWLAFNGALNKL